jgi:TonB family protein
MKVTIQKVVVVAAIALAMLACVAYPAQSFANDDARKIKQQVQPAYPELAKSMHIQGSVRLELVVSPTGSVKSVKVLGGHPVLADAAEKAVKNWKYEAGQEETRTVTIDFKQ